MLILFTVSTFDLYISVVALCTRFAVFHEILGQMRLISFCQTHTHTQKPSQLIFSSRIVLLPVSRRRPRSTVPDFQVAHSQVPR